LPIGRSAPGDDAPGAAGDTEAVWQEFHDRLRSFVSRRIGSDADAEDIVQKVFLQIHRSLPALRNAERLDAWLYQAARNAIADHHRAPGRRREVLAGDAADMEKLQSTHREDEGPNRSELAGAAACLRPMVDRLSEPYRRAITLVELQGASQRAAAEQEGLSFSGMKSRVQRGRQRLKAMLLERCQVALDRRGGVLGCEARSGGCGCRSTPTPR